MTTNKVQHGDVPAAAPSLTEQYLRMANEYHSGPKTSPQTVDQYLRIANEYHTGQQSALESMPRPPPLAGVPAGLEYLSELDQVTINQKTSMQEQLTRGAMPNRYTITNAQGQLIYLVGEQSDGLQRQCCGSNRGFVIYIRDNTGQNVIKVRKEFKCIRSIPCCECCCCCSLGGCSCIRMEIEVEAPIGQVCGYVQQKCTCSDARFVVLDAQHQDVFTIDGPRGCCSACNNYAMKDGKYTISTSGGAQQVGALTKHYMGMTLESLTTKDRFVATFPADLDVRMKAVLLGAVFLIDFMFFEFRR